MHFPGDRIHASGGKLDRHIGDTDDRKATARIDSLRCGDDRAWRTWADLRRLCHGVAAGGGVGAGTDRAGIPGRRDHAGGRRGAALPGTASWSARLLFPYLIVWSLLKVPALVVAPQIEGVWLGFGELAVLLAGGWTLFARLSGVREEGLWRFVTGENGVRAARYFFAVWLIPIGLSHIMYVKETMALVPAWLPLSNGMGVSDRRGADRLRAWNTIRRAAAGGCFLRGRHDQHLWAAGLAAEGGGRAEGAAAVDRVLDYMGDRGSGVGGGGECGGSASGFGARSCYCALIELLGIASAASDAPAQKWHSVTTVLYFHTPRLNGRHVYGRVSGFSFRDAPTSGR